MGNALKDTHLASVEAIEN
uniref:Uncharacterized protein n=1 Tax=Lepeophtheirus salmonis TaxID=72036 RepID=A0A0K2V167_LEPSM